VIADGHPTAEPKCLNVGRRDGGNVPRKDILSKFGITDRPDLQALIFEKNGLSVVDLRSPSDQGNGLTPKQATELSALLCKAGEKALGEEIASAVVKVQKTNLHRKE
jgi:hypothetical protein